MPQTFPVSVVLRCLARPRLGHVALLVGLALSLGVSLGAQAATTWTVCASGCDYTSIKAAIAASTTLNGDTLAIAAGVYTEPGIAVNKSLTLQGEDAATTIVQAATTRGTATDRVFTIPRGVSVILRALTIRYGHVSYDDGGGIYSSGKLTLTHSIISGNSGAYYGGGLYNNAGTLTLTHSIISGNSGAYYGGGLYNDAGTLTLTHSTVRGNSATYAGGGLYSSGTLTLTHSTVRGNSAAYYGGGLYGYGTLTLTHSTVRGNSAAYGGGLNTNYGTLTLTHSTISDNIAAAGGGLHQSGGRLTLTASLVAQNADGGDCRLYVTSSRSQGYNLDSDGSCELTASTDRPGVDPLLGPLQDNGGRTLTHALLPGSPAIDAIPWGTNGCGTTLYSDQRWQARPQPVGGACDIGAYEVEVTGPPLAAWVAGLTPQTAVCENVTTGQEVTLSGPASPWDCEAAGLAVSAGDQVRLHVQGPVTPGAVDVGGAVVRMAPNGGGCTNLTTGQQVTFQRVQGATAASCVAAGLKVQPGDTVQIQVQGAAE